MTERKTKDSLIEDLRWVVWEYGFPTPEQFEQVRREKWIKTGTRNHTAGEKGIQREQRQDGAIEVRHDRLDDFRSLIEGRTIAKFEQEPPSGEEWGHGEHGVSITLDDGAVLTFTGYGYDASGLDTQYVPASSVTEAPVAHDSQISDENPPS